MTKEEALEAKGRYGKTPGGNGYYYGQVVEVDASGNYALFRRGNKFKDRWVHSKDVTLHPVTPNAYLCGLRGFSRRSERALCYAGFDMKGKKCNGFKITCRGY